MLQKNASQDAFFFAENIQLSMVKLPIRFNMCAIVNLLKNLYALKTIISLVSIA